MGRASYITESVQDYVCRVLTRETPIQQRLRQETAQFPDARMQIGPDQGALLALLVRATAARHILEIGTFTGYSALAMASALPEDGELVTCDLSEEWTSIARRYWEEAGVAGRIHLRLGEASETLASLLRERGEGSFDFAFIDADKENYDVYYEACQRLVRRGGLIAVDNCIWSGKVADLKVNDPETTAIRALNRKIHDDLRMDACLLTIGDGLMLAFNRGGPHR
jgi:predicted O-methyltransferase YrrM